MYKIKKREKKIVSVF